MSSLFRTLVGKVPRLILTLICVTFLSFFMMNLLPGDPVSNFNVGANPEKLEQIRADLKLDQPLVVRYGSWLSNFATFDFGKNYGLASDPTENVKRSLPISIELMLYTQLFALAIAIPIGMLSAYKANGLFDRISSFIGFLALSIPAFVIAYLLKRTFTVDNDWLNDPWTKWLPWDQGEGSLLAHVKGAILPVVSLGVGQIAIYQRLLRTDMISTLQEDFITMARAKGMKPSRILFKHALRPSSLTLLTVVGINVGTLIGGAIVIENIFQIPGMGLNLISAYLAREYVAFQSYVSVIAVLYVVVNFLVDFTYSVLDPRIRDV